MLALRLISKVIDYKTQLEALKKPSLTHLTPLSPLPELPTITKQCVFFHISRIFLFLILFVFLVFLYLFLVFFKCVLLFFRFFINYNFFLIFLFFFDFVFCYPLFALNLSVSFVVADVVVVVFRLQSYWQNTHGFKMLYLFHSHSLI